MKKVKNLSLALFLVVIVFIVGCNSSGGSNNAQKVESAIPTPSQNEKASEKEKEVQKVTIKIAHESPASHPKGVWIDDFKKVVEDESGGNITVEVFHQGSLYAKEKAALEAVGQGIIQLSAGSTGYLSSIEPSFSLFDLPMLFENQDAMYKVLDGEIGQNLLTELESKGLKGLGYISNVPLDLLSKKPVTSLNDLSGMKIRVHSADLEKTVNALGGSPIIIPASEVFIGLQQGVINGVLTTVSYAAPNKLNEVVSHMTDIKISSIVYPVVMNQDFWNELNDENKQIINKAVQVATEKNRKELSAITDEHVKTLVDGGVTVHQLSTEERIIWKDKLETVYSQFKDQELLGKVK
ncbi:MAG: TRAP transporter substrate-binding protein [Paenibacillaceae bacterium]